MSSLTKIVKASAVVDDRHPPDRTLGLEAIAASMPVLKRGILPIMEAPGKQLRGKQSYLDELNRVKVEIAQARAELRGYRRELTDTKEMIAQAEALLQQEGGGEDILQRTRTLQQQAREEAKEIMDKAIADAESQRESLKNQGYLEGFNKGFEEASQEFVAENQPKALFLQEMIGCLSDFERAQIAKNQEELVQLVLGVANRVICKEIETTPEAIADMLYQTLDHNKREDFIKITLAADLLPVEAKASAQVRSMLEGMGANIRVYVDGDLAQGDCVVETPKGFTDISISTQLNNIGEALRSEE